MTEPKTTTHSSTVTKPPEEGGIFDTPGVSSQTEPDNTQTPEPKPEDNKPPDTEPQTPAAGNEAEPGTEPATEPEPGQEPKPGDITSEPQPAKGEPIEFRGRTFTNLDKFKENAEQSANEGIRLAGLNRDNQHLIQVLNKRIIELEDKETERPYPELKSKDELDEMSTAEQSEYFHKKNRWEDAQALNKTEREKNRTEYENYTKQVQSSMTEAERVMIEEVDKYPKFSESKPYREQILMASPYLNNRPNTHYDTWLMSMGLIYLDVMAASKAKTAESKANAKATAQAAATQTGEGGTPRTVKTGEAGEESDSVKVYHQRRGSAF